MSTIFTKSVIKPEQMLLLKAALFSGPEALENWQLWKEARNLSHFNKTSETLLPSIFDTLDYESQRLMPLVYRNLEKTNDPLIPGLRGIYRHTWIRNQRFMLKAQQVIKTLQTAGIDTIALKGIALSLRYYGDMGVRLMNDLDVLVPPDKAEKAIQLLQEQPLGFQRSKFDYRYRRILHAMHMWDEEQTDMDLHWNLMVQHAYADADGPFWAARQPVTLADGSVTSVLSPTHQLFHNIVHGFGWAGKPAIRWVADSYAIYAKAKAAIDWHELLSLAERYRFIIPIQQGLGILEKDFHLVLPAEVRQRLNQMQLDTLEKDYFTLLQKKPTNIIGKLVRQVQLPRMEYRSFQLERSGIPKNRWMLIRLERFTLTMSRWAFEVAQAKLKESGLVTSRR
ncbi:nucleotidyltransferase domain-containing protein [Tellurirhabdus bombi]|uniref:nucleotidyltransferase domain-containing protein n=1 Tax=Tellurirhabdus bombi TaxID=2907205 RepID=UPI001F1E9233|nr:nucleotidyltransferase family protein [Tellurirhabdus bombi]